MSSVPGCQHGRLCLVILLGESPVRRVHSISISSTAVVPFFQKAPMTFCSVLAGCDFDSNTGCLLWKDSIASL